MATDSHAKNTVHLAVVSAHHFHLRSAHLFQVTTWHLARM